MRPWGLLLGFVLVAGCSASGEADATRAARDFVSAVADGRTDAACALLAPRAAQDVDCQAAFAELGDLGSVESAEVWGEGAKATAGSSVLFLHEFAAGWRVTGAGCRSHGEEPYDCAVGGP
ncbi:hypothetical protein [Actinokineospora sp. HUAS TT18]|uniref:hypothetical protein n=1 Tax=Actinokineospora sp. HUAS TT18 TaxID=3447451 RepID=UPI003F520B90